MGAVDLLEERLRGDNGVEVTFFLGIPAVISRTGGIVDHHRNPAAHQGTEHCQGTARRGGYHHADKAFREFFKFTAKNKGSNQGLGIG